ncbi:WXG100 family type VII secretion target [Saccharopolyspora sp. NPDC049426]|uniref:WXG100 family type VII secretion target n=1 Tax=Saccharopolyspora sp. NPDC049426 TaxID=3155652 RepID=UPI0034282383
MSTEHQHYLAGIAEELDVPYFSPTAVDELVGRPEDFRAAAQVWREAAAVVEQSSGDVDGKLGGIDTAWQGADAEAFVAHVRDAGLAGKDLADAMTGLADALDHTAEGVGAQERRLNELVARTADDVRAAMTAADAERARKHLADLAEPARELLESIADYYMAFTRLCDDMAGVATREPGRWEAQAPAAVSAGTPATPGVSEVAWTADPTGTTSPSGTAAASAESEEDQSGTGAAAGGIAAGAAVGAAGVGMGMMPMGMMGGMMGQRGGGNQERQNSSRLKSNPDELFGAQPEVPPAVFGEPAKSQQPQADQNPQEPQAAPGKLDLPSTLQPAPPKLSIDEVLAPKADSKPKPESGTAGVGDAPPPKPRG